jgi:hypothetical protein
MSRTTALDRIGVGIDTARYGHRVSFLRPDRRPAAPPLTVLENHTGYQALQARLEQLHQQHPQAHFHIRIDAAGQYAANLEHFLRSLPLPLILSIGEPKRNKDYQKAHFPKRTTDDTESQAMARFAIVEQPPATPASTPALALLREVAGAGWSKAVTGTRTTGTRIHTSKGSVCGLSTARSPTGTEHGYSGETTTSSALAAVTGAAWSVLPDTTAGSTTASASASAEVPR